jgi:hypothetical protein
MRNVTSIASEVPIYPNSSQVGDPHVISKPNVALVGRRFKASVNYAELKHFYIEKLTPMGWRLEEERSISDWGQDLGGGEMTFSRNEYIMVITYAGERANYAWVYVIDVKWKG